MNAATNSGEGLDPVAFWGLIIACLGLLVAAGAQVQIWWHRRADTPVPRWRLRTDLFESSNTVTPSGHAGIWCELTNVGDGVAYDIEVTGAVQHPPGYDPSYRVRLSAAVLPPGDDLRFMYVARVGDDVELNSWGIFERKPAAYKLDGASFDVNWTHPPRRSKRRSKTISVAV